MRQEYHAKSVQEAVKLAKELSNEYGFDIFRGQLHPWLPIPSLLRLNPEQQMKAVSTLKQFISWGMATPELADYEYKDFELLAIAQHYGIPTNLLDVSRSPEIAGFFATDGKPPPNSKYSVIYCGNTRLIKRKKNFSILNLNVENLWRLEAQQGLFLAFLEEIKLETLDSIFTKILFERLGDSGIEYFSVYPQRKSHLETILDYYFEHQSFIDLLENTKKNVPRVISRRWHTYPGIFHSRQLPPEHPTWKNLDKSWVQVRKESFYASRTQKEIIIHEPPNKDIAAIYKSYIYIWKTAFKNGLKRQDFVSLNIQWKRLKEGHKDFIKQCCEQLWDRIRTRPYTSFWCETCNRRYKDSLKSGFAPNGSLCFYIFFVH